MPKKAKPLTAAECRAAQFTGKSRRLFDGDGLFLLVNRSGRYWYSRYRMDGKRQDLYLGPFPEISLAQARGINAAMGDKRRSGIDPGEQRREERATVQDGMTFETLARDWFAEVHRKTVVGGHAARNLRRLERHLFPAIGALPVSDVTPKVLLTALRTIDSTDTAHRLKTLAGQVLRYGVAHGLDCRDCSADLKGAIAPKGTNHYPALTDPGEVGALLRAVWGYGGEPSTRAALILLAYLFPRPGEMRQAKWEAFDLDGAVWNYQPGKGGLALLTPLPAQAVEILRGHQRLTGHTPFLFPSPRSDQRPISDMTLSGALARLGYRGQVVAHSFRATARTLIAERLGCPAHLIEMQLGHTVPDSLGRAYNRTVFLNERRDMLQRYADYLDTLRDTLPRY